MTAECLKALANEDTLLLMMFLGLRKLGNICCGHKMFLNKIRNIFCVPDTKFVSATNVARAGKRGNICVSNDESAKMCPRLPGPLSSKRVIASARRAWPNRVSSRSKSPASIYLRLSFLLHAPKNRSQNKQILTNFAPELLASHARRETSTIQ